jgi:hypothetical protein
VNDDDWDLREVSLDDIVTATKVSGCSAMLRGFTTPEGWPFAVVVAIAKPGSEVAVQLAEEFSAKLTALGADLSRVDRAPWPERPMFTCPKCGRISHNPNDLAHRYCGACHEFFPEVAQ